MRYDNIIQRNYLTFHMTKRRLRLYSYAGEIAQFSSTYEIVNDVDGLQESSCIGHKT